MDEIHRIFEVTGGYERFDKIEHFSQQKAESMGYSENGDNYSDYVSYIYTTNNGQHNRQ
jgi:heterodisulfide reductase subunit C